MRDQDGQLLGPRTLALLDQLSASVSNAGDRTAPSSGAAVPTRAAFEHTVFLCHLAYNGDQNAKSKVVDAAADACYGMIYLVGKDVPAACLSLDRAISKVFMMGASDPLASEANGLSDRLTQRSASLDCAAMIAAKVAADKAEAARQAAAAASPAPVVNPYPKRNDIINAINGEKQALDNDYDAAKLWYDRGEDAEACGQYQRAMGSLRRLERLYADLNRETGDSEYSATSREINDHQNELREEVGDICVDAGRRIY